MTEKRKKIRVTIDVTDIYELIKCLADKEKRDISNMCNILITEAIHNRHTRKGVVPITEIFRSLPFTESRGLLEIIKKAVTLLANQIFNKNPTSRFIQGWDITKLAAISGISEERLSRLAEGGANQKITPEEAIALMHAGMNPLELATMTQPKEGEPNGTGTKHE